MVKYCGVPVVLSTVALIKKQDPSKFLSQRTRDLHGNMTKLPKMETMKNHPPRLVYPPWRAP